MYDEEFDWADPNYGFQHPAQLIEPTAPLAKRAEFGSWVEDYWLELAQLAWNGFSEGYRGLVVAVMRTTPTDLTNFANWLTDPKVPSCMGYRDAWYVSWQEGKVPEPLYGDQSLTRKVATYDPKSQLVIAFLSPDHKCQGHFMAFCQDAYPINAKECSDKSLNHIIAKYGSKRDLR